MAITVETGAPSGDHYGKSVWVIAAVSPSSDYYGTTKVAPPSIICMYVCITFISDSAIQNNIVIQCWGQ